MITVGIDCGNRNTKAIVLFDGKVEGKAVTLTDFNPEGAALKAYEMALKEAGLNKEQVAAIASTGVGRNRVGFTEKLLTEAGSAARGARFVNAHANTVIDLGAEGSRAVRLSTDGTIDKFAANDKCATGGGAFVETIARALQVRPEEMGPLSMQHTKVLSMNAQCVVFAESEVISLIHQKTNPEDIAHAVHEGLANRISGIVRRVGLIDDIVLIGGPAHNIGLVQSLKGDLARGIMVPDDPEYISALGAAIYAAEITESGQDTRIV